MSIREQVLKNSLIFVHYTSYYGYRKYRLENWNCTQDVALPTVKLEKSEETETATVIAGIVKPEKKHQFFGKKTQRSSGKK